MNSKAQRHTVGAVFSVPLGEHGRCYALTLPEADFAFCGPQYCPGRLYSQSLRARGALSCGCAQVGVGYWPLEQGCELDVPAALLEPEPKFIQDAVNPSKFELYVGGTIRPASKSDCQGLERAAVWEPEHIEQRLRDHQDGVPKVWVEQLRIK